MDLITKSKIQLRCDLCNRIYKKSITLETHKRNYHNTEGTNKCNQCSAEFHTERQLNGHIKRIHHDFRCGQCEKSYKSRESLRLHEFNHVGCLTAAAFRCNHAKCNKTFQNPRRLRDHQRHTHDEGGGNQLICELCGYRTRVRVNLLVHMRRHSGERPYCCELCGKCFASLHQLKEHRAMHTQARSHKCPSCGVDFVHAKALYHHMQLHLEEKRYTCVLCSRTFAQAAGLSGHMRRHQTNAEHCKTAHVVILAL